MVARNGLDAEEDSAFVGESVHGEIVMFAVHPGGHEVVTVSRQLLLRHWVLDVKRSGKSLPPMAMIQGSQSQSDSEAVAEVPSVGYRVRQHVWKSLHRTAITASEYDTSGTLVATAGSERVIKSGTCGAGIARIT